MTRSTTRTTAGIVAAIGLAFGAGIFINGTSQTSTASPQDAGDRLGELKKDIEKRLSGSQDAPPEIPDDMMASFAVVMEPGEHHEQLDALIGTWDVKVKMWVEPDSTPMTSEGTMRRRWVLGGRFVQERLEAESPFADGTFEAIGFIGYNTIDKQYEMVWLENLSTVMTFNHGVYNSANNTMRFFGQSRNPDGSVTTAWSESDMSDPDKHTLTGWAIGADGAPFKNFQGVFTKRN